MAPPFLPLRHYAPSQVTEDTPPDLLEGTMDLEVTLPNGKTVIMSVHRSTPMMDLLIQVTTAHRINPGGHVIQVISDNIFLTYKPSTPIGTLDTNAIKIVSKNALNEISKARKSNLQQEAIERNIRLKPKEWVYKQQLVVNLPRNQLAVYRVPPKSLISEIFSMVCEDKNLDPETHEIRHPANVDERLRGSCSLSDYQLQEVCIVSSDFRPPPLSVTDLITMSSIAHPEDKKRRGIFGIFSRKAKSSTGDSSVSSGSAGERSVSPARSDESVEGRPSSQAQSHNSSSATLTNIYHKSNTLGNNVSSSDRNSLNSTETTRISRPISMISLNKTKKRPAPVPPQRIKRTTDEQSVNEKRNSSLEKTNLSRHNSDSSGYHEQERKSFHTSPSCSEVGSIEANRSVLRPASNLTTVSNNSSTTSVKAGKRKAPSPPRSSVIRNGRTSPSSIPESPEGNETKQTLEVCEETASNGYSSEGSVKVNSENLTKEKGDQDDSMSESSSQKNFSENPLNNLEDKSQLSSSVTNSQTIDKGHNMQDSNTENPLPRETSLVAPEVKEENHNEILKVSIVEPLVEKTALETTENPVVTNSSSSSSSPPLVASEGEVKTRIVSLSTETSCTSIEMMNPKDIQRPKRHRRKKIPEEFMKNTASTDSLVSSDSAHVLENNHVASVSMSLQQPKNFVNVHEEVEKKIEVASKNIEPTSAKDVCNDGFEEIDPKTDAQSDLKIVNEKLKEEESSSNEVPNDGHSDCINTNAQLSVVYIEDLNEEESTTDPITPPIRKKIFTTKLQLPAKDQVWAASKDEKSDAVPQPSSTIKLNKTVVENGNSEFPKSCQEEVIAELKTTIENPDTNSGHRPIILNLKQKENKDWNIERSSDYNLILNVNTKARDSYSSDSTFLRSASASSYESFDTNSLKKSSPSTETSYESVPPPLPDSRIPQSSDCDSKTSSVLSRQSSFSDHETVEFTKPNAPAFSISTYESRASKISYNKKLSRSGSLASFKDIQSSELSNSDDRKLNRSDSQRNEVFRSDNLKKKCTSTTFLNLSSNNDNKEEEKISFSSNVRPSLIKSRSRPSLHEIGLDNTDTINDMSRTIQFDVSSSKEPITFTRPLPFKTYNNLRKAKSQHDIRNDNRMAEGYQGIPDSGLANEYMRLQDDFVKWQQQLLQNQQLLHNRVAPIAANPPVLNNAGLVNNMLNQSTPGAPQQPQQQQQQRKPVEITIPIRLVDSDEEDAGNTPQPQPQPKPQPQLQPQPQPKPKLVANQAFQRNPQEDAPSGSRWNGPNVSIDSWQERPSYVVVTQPTVIEPSVPPRSFANQPRMQTVFQSAPNDWKDRDTVLDKPGFQQKPPVTQQRLQQNIATHPQQSSTRPEFYPVQQQQNTVTYPQQNISRPEFYYVNPPQSNFNQEPQPHFRQIPQTNFQEVPQQNHIRNETSQEQLKNVEPHQPVYKQNQVYNSNSVPDSNSIKFSEQNTPFAPRPYSQNLNRQQQQVIPPPVVDKGDEGINARFSSVVTLSNDKNDQNVPQKDKVRSVVQLNNTSPQIDQSSVPFHSKIISAANNKVVNNRDCEGPISFQSSDASSVAPMSSRLVQQAVQQPYGGTRISPPKIEHLYSPPQSEQRLSLPTIERHYQTPTIEREPSPPKSEPSLPFGEVKLRHVESPRVSPPKTIAPEPFVAAPPPPPPPPPPSKASAGPPAPPPPPPAPVMSEADRRAATGKKILGAQLDPREELMMAIRQFGGSQKLRKSAFCPPN